MPSMKHVHKYMRQEMSPGNWVWRCALPGCTHYLPKNWEGSIDGSLSRCWQCSETFMLDEETIKNNQPVCSACGTSPEEKEAAEDLEIRIKIAEKTGIGWSEVPQEEVDKAKRFRNLIK